VDKYESGEGIFAKKRQENLTIFHGGLPDTVDDDLGTTGGSEIAPYGIDHEGLTYTASHGHDTQVEGVRFFRPVMYEQARLTQLNLVDYFGKVIYATDPRPGKPNAPFYPYIGENILYETCPGIKAGTKDASTAIRFTSDEISNGNYPWFQVAPHINQDARIHAVFMCDQASINNKQPSTGSYRPMSKGEATIFAWLLINFNNQSLQVYDDIGSFKGEALLPSGPKEPTYWESLLGKGNCLDVLPYITPAEASPILRNY
jgi:hypothetical protein